MRISDWSADVCSSDRHRILRRSSGDLSNRRFHARLRGRSGIREAVRDVSAVFVAATIQAVIVVEPLTNWTSRTGWKRLRFTINHDAEDRQSDGEGKSVSVSVALGVSRTTTKKIEKQARNTDSTPITS